MKRLALAFLIAISMGHGTITYAQDSLVGTYNGSYTYPGGRGHSPISATVQLIIASVENGVAKGTATTFQNASAGEYPMEGKIDGNKLTMKSTAKGGRTGDCTFGFNVTQEGGKFVGTTGSGYPLQLSK